MQANDAKLEECWRTLDEHAAVEYDPDKLRLLVFRVNGLLDTIENRLTMLGGQPSQMSCRRFT